MTEHAAAVVRLILDEPWFTYHVDHDDGIERTSLQLALCSLAGVTPSGLVHHPDDGCLEHMEEEDERDRLAATASASRSTDPECRAVGHDYRRPWELRDVCTRCGCVRILQGNPSRYVYEHGA